MGCLAETPRRVTEAAGDELERWTDRRREEDLRVAEQRATRTDTGERNTERAVSLFIRGVLLPWASECAPSLTTKMEEMEREQPDCLCSFLLIFKRQCL